MAYLLCKSGCRSNGRTILPHIRGLISGSKIVHTSKRFSLLLLSGGTLSGHQLSLWQPLVQIAGSHKGHFQFMDDVIQTCSYGIKEDLSKDSVELAKKRTLT